MEEKKTVLEYLGNAVTTFGGTVIFFIILGPVVGVYAGEKSTLFALGDIGMSYSTLVQLLVMAAFITTYRFLFFSDVLLKEKSIAFRTVCMLSLVIVTIIIFVILFGWFDVKDIKAWIGFIASFTVCFLLSAGVTYINEKRENDQMQEALDRMQKK